MDWFGTPADPAENNAQREQARREREDAETWRRWMSHPNGRSLLHRLLERCHIYGSPFAAGEPETTFFRLGEENVGRLIMMEIMTAVPDLYMIMLAEGRQRKEREAALAAEAERERERAENPIPQQDDLKPPPGWTK